jgi:hypothetical protein
MPLGGMADCFEKDPLTRFSRLAGFATLSPKGAREEFFHGFWVPVS